MKTKKNKQPSKYARMRAALVIIHENERVLRDFQMSGYAKDRLEKIRLAVREVLGDYSLADAQDWKEAGEVKG